VSIDVIIADDHDVVRAGLKAVLTGSKKNIRVTGEAADGKEALNLAKKKPADVYILDISMPMLNGIETTARILKINFNSRIIILTMYDNVSFIEKVLTCGAKGYVLKENASEEIVRAVCEVHRGGCFLSPQVAKHVVKGFVGRIARQPELNFKKLTGREREILQQIAEGLSSKEIAVKLKVSFNTVLVHRNNIMKKLSLHKQAELIRYAIKEGITGL